MNSIRLSSIILISIIVISCKNEESKVEGWPKDKVQQYMDVCMSEEQTKEECVCQVEKFENEFSWQEIKTLEGQNNQSFIDRTEKVLDAILLDCFGVNIDDLNPNE